MTTTFNASSTTQDVLNGIDLRGKTALVTGGSTGLGYETARALASAGADIILCARPGAKLDAARQRLQDQYAGVKVSAVGVDLGDLASVRTSTDELNRGLKRLDILINNAGIMACPMARTAQAHESQFGVNHLGHFLFTLRLQSLLEASTPARIVCLTSAGHKYAGVDFDDIDYTRRDYNKWQAYGQSKTACALFAVGLSRKWGPRVLANSVHPGVIITELGRHLTPEDIEFLTKKSPRAGTMTMKSVEAGAATSVWAATAAELEGRGGLYLEDCGIAPPAESAVSAKGFLPYAVDPDLADRLWQVSLEWVGDYL